MYITIKKNKTFSKKKLRLLKKEFKRNLDNKSYTIIVTGSFARYEASENSDIDILILFKEGKPPKKNLIKKILLSCINKIDYGTFSLNSITHKDHLFKNIGGDFDSNKMITKRLSLIFESKSLYNKALFNKIKEKLIYLYLKKRNLQNLLLKDLDRYNNNLSIDFNYKITELKKTYFLRHIKLLYARKLLYFTNLYILNDYYKTKNIEKFIKDIKLSPSKRIKRFCNNQMSKKILSIYEIYLRSISSKKTRLALEKLTKEKNYPIYNFLLKKNKVFLNTLFYYLYKNCTFIIKKKFFS